MMPSPGPIDIAAKTQKLDVDHRISLRIYYRIADNLLRQANIFRNEKNVIDLYVMLLRFSRLQQVMAIEDGVAARKDDTNLDHEKPSLQPTLELRSENHKPQNDEQPMISFETSDVPETVIVKQPNPPSVLAEVLDLIPAEPPLITENNDSINTPFQDTLLQPESPMELHIDYRVKSFGRIGVIQVELHFN
ncbi:AMSH-like ubiquitin thioesterase 1 [Bienertia sinuspersici]